MQANYALNHHWCETGLFPQAVLNYVMSRDFIIKKPVQLRDQSCILTRMKKSMALFHIRIFSVFSLHFALLQHVGHKCMGHMYVTVTSGLINESTSVTHFQP